MASLKGIAWKWSQKAKFLKGISQYDLCALENIKKMFKESTVLSLGENLTFDGALCKGMKYIFGVQKHSSVNAQLAACWKFAT